MLNTFKFPDGFLWGAATSAHQVEGENRFNDWWAWEQDGKVKEKSGKAANHYQLFREDIKLAKRLNHNSFRFSAEWSRIEPEKELWDKVALSHYKEVIDFSLDLNIEPIVTINHFTLPLWFSNLGGWEKAGSIDYFERFVEKIAAHFGGKVKFWVVFNEPVVYIYKSYIEGIWPPGKRSYLDAATVFRNLARASSAAYRIIHKVYADRAWSKPMVGVAKNLLTFQPCSPASRLDGLSASARNYCFNYLFIKCLIDKKALDFIGVNYYKRDFIHNLGFNPAKIFGDTCPLAHGHGSGKKNYLGWESYPEGLGEKLLEFSKFNLPLLIAENGFCSENDKDRWDYIYSHLKEVTRALGQGARVIGYLYWSLMDNFEWADGFGPRFGLVEIDYKTQKRSIRESAYKFATVCKENRL